MLATVNTGEEDIEVDETDKETQEVEMEVHANLPSEDEACK